MKVLIAGYGSMGKRRIRLLKKLVKDIRFICVDTRKDRLEQIEADGLYGFQSLEEALAQKPELAFVCTSPGNHHGIILKIVQEGIHVFTELNLSSQGYDQILQKAQENQVQVFMSSSMLYDRQIEYIDRVVKMQRKPVTYIYHVGQYLPDWHPWENYRDFFAGNKSTNGVREICAIQLPWMIHTFGTIETLSCVSQKCTDLDIDFCDSLAASFRHSNGNIGVFVADTVSRKATTHLEVIGENVHIFWNGHHDDLFVYDMETEKMIQVETYCSVEHIPGYADNIIEDRYLDELRDFLNTVYKNTAPRYSLEADRYTLAVIDRMERDGRCSFYL